jgi:hypothetical protein
MDDFEKAEFWEGLNRLYTTSVELRKATEILAATARSHENGLDSAEIYIQFMLEDAKGDRLALAKAGDTARDALEKAEASEKRMHARFV